MTAARITAAIAGSVIAGLIALGAAVGIHPGEVAPDPGPVLSSCNAAFDSGAELPARCTGALGG